MPNYEINYANDSTYGIPSNDLRHSRLEWTNNLPGMSICWLHAMHLMSHT